QSILGVAQPASAMTSSIIPVHPAKRVCLRPLILTRYSGGSCAQPRVYTGVFSCQLPHWPVTLSRDDQRFAAYRKAGGDMGTDFRDAGSNYFHLVRQLVAFAGRNRRDGRLSPLQVGQAWGSKAPSADFTEGGVCL